MITFDEFVEAQYNQLTPLYKKLYKSKDKYKASFDFRVWLETFRDAYLDLEEVYHICSAYYRHGNTTIEDLPSVLSLIARQYNIELPDVGGLLTPAYWRARLGE